MRRPRFRPRLWMLMALIAILAVGWSLTVRIVDLRERSLSHREAADGHRTLEAEARKTAVREDGWAKEVRVKASKYGPTTIAPSTTVGAPAHTWAYWVDFHENNAAKQHRIADFHAAMRAKYERLARYPWLPVAPDPPEPE